ncbi:CVNH domain protein [Aspergillus parasiticus SU-1]|uniref:CVNH domain protein n=1 Tax=Aspergillus parasiticus (strain ATCC 56775 / NRRL 5862 / SRRC 143 / SU-1) TaxID=1403190 RepID=A0A0F0I464_ASPPU|nr:CVNH domain protein [Aspergillus parasiticus SU-1]
MARPAQLRPVVVSFEGAAMSFHKSCHTIDIEIYEDRTFLTAYSDPGDGYREMDLDDAIRNEDGKYDILTELL